MSIRCCDLSKSAYFEHRGSNSAVLFFSRHKVTKAHELPQAGSPYPGSSFSAPADRGTRTAAGGFALTGGSFSASTERGTRTAAGGFAPNGRQVFSAPADWGTRTASAGSPLTGGKFFAEPQRGIRRLRTAGTLRRPPRGQKGRDTYGFPSSLNSYLSLAS